MRKTNNQNRIIYPGIIFGGINKPDGGRIICGGIGQPIDGQTKLLLI